MTQKNLAIEELENENVSLKAGGSKVDTVKPLIQKIKYQKSYYDTKFRGNEFALVMNQTDVDFMKSINTINEADVQTQKDVEKLGGFSNCWFQISL